MTTLQKLRKHQGLLVGAILFALLAFVLGEAINSQGMFHSGAPEIGSVGDHTLQYQQYQEMINNLQEQNREASYAEISQYVWDSWVEERVMEKQYEELGIKIGNKGILNGVLKLPEVLQTPMFLNGLGEPDPTAVRQWVDIVRQGAETGDPQAVQMYNYWQSMKQTAEARQKANLYTLMAIAGFNATELDAKAEHFFQTAQVDGTLAYLPYSSVEDSSVQVSDKEIENYIKKNSDKYQREETRDIQYVSIPLTPSVEDVEAVRLKMESLLEDREEYDAKTNSSQKILGFAATKDDSTFVRTYTDAGFDYDKRFYHHFDNEDLNVWAFSAKVGDIKGPYKEGDTYRLSKLVGIASLPDSVKASHILIPYAGAQYNDPSVTRTKEQAKATADSLARIIRSGKGDFAALADEYSSDRSPLGGGSLGWIKHTGEPFLANLEEIFFHKPKGTVEVAETPAGFHVVKVDDRVAPSKAVQLATIVNTISPSNETVNKLYNDAQSLAAGKNSVEQFVNAAREEGYRVMPFEEFTPLQSVIGSFGDQTQIIRWAYEKDRAIGDVRVFDVPQAYLVAILSGRAEKGLATVDEVREEVTAALVREKKANILKERFKSARAASVEEIARKAEARLIPVVSLTFTSNIVPEAGTDPLIIGTMLGLKEGQISSPIADNTGVFVGQVTARRDAASIEDYSSLQGALENNYRSLTSSMFDALKKAAEVEDNRAEVAKM